METTVTRYEVHTDKRDIRRSGNKMQTTSTRDRLRGLQYYRQRNNRYAIPVGTRSMGYFTKLVKPTLDPNSFEESFSHREYEWASFEKTTAQHCRAAPGALGLESSSSRLARPNGGIPPGRPLIDVLRCGMPEFRVYSSTSTHPCATCKNRHCTLRKNLLRHFLDGHRNRQSRPDYRRIKPSRTVGQSRLDSC